MSFDSLDDHTEDTLLGIQLERIKREKAKRSVLFFTDYFTPEYNIGWFHRELGETLDAFVQAVEEKRSPRLIIEVPPRAGKSQIVSRCFPPFLLGAHPEWEVVAATYGQDLADDMGRYVRSILNDPQYKDLFPNTVVDPQSNAVDRIDTLSRGGYKAVGVGSALTGRGATCLLIDDPIKDREAADSERTRGRIYDWYSSTARTRLAPGGGIILLMTRWHEDDLAGRLQAVAKDNPKAEQWHVIKYPAIATEDEKNRKEGEALHPERYDEKAYEMIRETILARDWSALYQQNPTPDEGLYYNREDIERAMYRPGEEPDDLYYYLVGDLAISEREEADYTCLWVFGVDHRGVMWFMDDIYHKRAGSLEMTDQILKMAEKYKVMKICLEKGHIQLAIGPLLRKRMQERGHYFSIHAPTPTKDKIARSRSLQGRLEQGMVKIPKTPFIEQRAIPELLSFPAGKYDDINDTMVWGSLLLEELVGATPSVPLPDDAPAVGSYEYYKRRTPNRSGHKSVGHTPRRLNGKPRKPKK